MKPTDTRPLGRTGLDLTVIGCGGSWLARVPGPHSYDLAQATVDDAWNAGIRHFDTAPSYGFGLSERRLGDALSHRPRADFVLSTKVGRVLKATDPGGVPKTTYADQLPFMPQFDYTYDGILRSFEDSLLRLGIWRVDILLIHDLVLRHAGSLEVLRQRQAELWEGGGYKALLSLRDQKLIGGFGAGLNSAKACAALAERGDFDCFMLAGHYTLLDQDALDTLFPICHSRNISVIMAAIFNTGVLASGPVAGAWYDYRPATPEILERVRRIQAVCLEYDTPLIDAALQFPLVHPVVASVTLGMSSPAEVNSNVQSLQREVPAGLYRKLVTDGLLREDAVVD